MEDWRGEIWERAELFAAENGRTLIGQLGYGYDGNVFATERQSAIKVLRFQRLYERERDVYLRLRSRSIIDVAGFAVPQLIHHDDRLWVVEMGIVSPPFVLDFAGAYLDRRAERFANNQALANKLTAIHVRFLVGPANAGIELIWQNWR